MPINFSPLKALRIPALMTSIFVIVLLAYYYFWVAGKAAYLESRNFRLLATASRQIDESVETQVKVIQSIIEDDQFIAQLKDRVAHIDKDESGRALLEVIDKIDKDCPNGAPEVYVESDAGHNWVRVGVCHNGKQYRTRFSLDKTLQGIFSEEAKQQAFGSMLLAWTGGAVIYQSAAAEQKLTRLDKLTPGASAPAPPAFATLAHATNSFSAELSGATHHIFVQPCCRSLVADAPAAKPKSDAPVVNVTGPPTAAEKEAEGLVLCGLVSARRMTFGSMEISLTLLALITGVILAASCCWPFLKLSLIGERQRVQLLDVLSVGSCAVLLLALVTLTGLDAAAYLDFKEGLAQRLEDLAHQIKDETRSELARAYAQLVELEAKALANEQEIARRQQRLQEYYPASYAPYTEFFLMDEDGKQFAKHPMRHNRMDEDGQQFAKDPMQRNRGNPAISVADREYFLQVKKGRTWPASELFAPLIFKPPTPPTWTAASAPPALAGTFELPTERRYVLESIHSRSTGHRRAIMAKPSREKKPHDKPLRAAAIGLSLRPLIEPVLPYGFGFAVIEDDGRVIFHADEERNLIENFFAEADNDRRLRAAVAAHRAAHVEVRYGGQAYAAYVSPFEALPGSTWHLITFYDRQLPRTLNVQWLALAVLLLSCYALLFVLFGALVLLLRPHYRAPWLWPDQARTNRYLILLALYLIPALILGRLIYDNTTGWPLLRAVAWSLLAVWALTWAVLWPAPTASEDEPSWKMARRSRATLISAYAFFWVAHLLLIAVLPTIAFFQIAHRVQTDAYLKHAQLNFAADLNKSQARIKEDNAGLSPTDPQTRPIAYGAGLLYLPPQQELPLDCRAEELLPLINSSALPGLLEAQSATHSLFSVQLSEMSRGNCASDDLWTSYRRAPDQRVLLLRLKTGDAAPLYVQTTVPRMLAHDSLEDTLLIIATALAVCLLAWWLVRFACRRIFLIDLMPPVWRDARGRLQVSGGYHTFIYYRDNAQAADYRQEAVVDFRQWLPTDERGDWRVMLGELMESQPLGAPIVLDHFEREMHNAAFNGQKLDVVEELIRVHNRTVIILTAAHPAPVFAYFQTPAPPGDAQHARRGEVLSAFSVIDVEALPFASLPPTPIASAPATDFSDSATVDAVPAAANGAHTGVKEHLRRLLQWTSAHVPPAGHWQREYNNPLFNLLWEEVAPNVGAAGRPHTLSSDIIEEVNDRAGRYYYQLWAACTPAEKTVLVHLAQDGFLNHEDRRTIRRLMMRGFIVRGPHLRLQSVLLRAFLLTHTCRAEAAKLAAAPRSAWDSFKWPFLIVLGAVVLFFFATQQELFNATVALITGIAGATPVLIRVIGLLLGKRPPDEEAQK